MMAIKPSPMFRLTLPLVAGIFISYSFFRGTLPVMPVGIALCVCLAGMSVLLKWRNYSFRWAFGCMASVFLFCLGALLLQHQWQCVSYEWAPGERLYRGVVTDAPQEKEKTYLYKVRVDSELSDGKMLPVNRTVLVYVMKDSLSRVLQCGDHLDFYTRMRVPESPAVPGEFDYAAYLFRQQISGTAVVFPGYWQPAGKRSPLTLKQQANAWREKMLAQYKDWGFSGDEFAVLSALTVGYKEELTDELREVYQTAGVSHILALSGMHVAILWGLLCLVLRPLGRSRVAEWGRCVLVVTLLWAFAFLVGLSASVVRAVVICMLMTIAHTVGGRVYSLNTLAIAAFFMLLYHPFYLFDVGFQLSFLAVLSILLIYPVFFYSLTVHQPVLRYVWGIMSVSLAAQLGTAPLVVYYFSHFPVYFLPANLIVAPLVFVILYGAVAVFALSPLAALQVWAVKGLDGLLWLLNNSMRWVENLPWSQSGNVHVSLAQVIVLYVLLLMMLAYWVHRSRKWLIALLCGINLFMGVTCYRYMREEPPQLVFTRSQVKAWPQKELWQQDSIYRCKGMNICVLTDGRWQDKKAAGLLDIDYLYLCRGFRGKIAPLQNLFRIKKVILDSSLSDYRLDRLREECKSLGLDYIDISAKGSYRIFL